LAVSGHPSPVTTVIEAKASTNTPSVGRHVGTDFGTRRLHREARRRKTPPPSLLASLVRGVQTLACPRHSPSTAATPPPSLRASCSPACNHRAHSDTSKPRDVARSIWAASRAHLRTMRTVCCKNLKTPSSTYFPTSMVIKAAKGTGWRTSANISFGTGTALGYALSVLNCVPQAVASKSLQEADLCPAPRSWVSTWRNG
jgi:hypothetical protein